MEHVAWLIDRLGDARCASCGLRYAKSAVRGIGYENDHWFVYVTCVGCGTQGIAHELLAPHRGDIHGLSAPRSRQPVR